MQAEARRRAFIAQINAGVCPTLFVVIDYPEPEKADCEPPADILGDA